MKKRILFFLVISFVSISVTAQIIHVPADQTTIQSGIDYANDGDTVLVANGTYFENIRFKGKAITVASEYIIDSDTNHINNTIIDGSQSLDPDSAACIMFVNGEDTTSIINGFTITGGAGVKVSIYQLQIGGGIYTSKSGSKIINNKIINNQVEGYNAGGSGIMCWWDGVDTWSIIDNNTIINNIAISNGYSAFGSGICITTNSIIKNNLIAYNTCNNDSEYADGGGIEVEQGPGSIIVTHIYNNVIKQNVVNGIKTAWGAGISIKAANEIVIENNLIIDNLANSSITSLGAGVYLNNFNHLIFQNVTLANNSCNFSGGGIYSDVENTEVMNCILWNNSPNELEGSFLITYSDIQGGGWSGVGNIDEDPVFLGHGAHQFELSGGSPCIDEGTPDTSGLNLPPWDIIGNQRIMDGNNDGIAIIDMGAYEKSPSIGTNNQIINDIEFSLNIYPNPFTTTTTFEFDLANPCNVNITILNHLGQHVESIDKGNQSGEQQFVWNASGLSNGIYFVQLRAGQEVTTRKVIKMR